MKVKFKNISETEQDEFYKSEHLVLAYGVYDEKTKIFLIADQELEIMEPDDKCLEITDTDLEDYENYPGLLFNKDFYVQKDFLKVAKQFDSYYDFKCDSVWLKTKFAQFYIEKGYPLSSDFKETVLSEKYKLGLINGFLIFANHYLNRNNSDSSFRNNFRFVKADTLNAIIPSSYRDENFKMERLYVDNYETLLVGFITEKLHHNDEKGIDPDKYLIRDFFELIDAVFVNQIQEMYRIKTYYDDMIVIKYNEKYYYLNYDWST